MSKELISIMICEVKNQIMFVKHYATGVNKVQKDILSTEVEVKVTMSLTLVSFERVPLVKYACQI